MGDHGRGNQSHRSFPTVSWQKDGSALRSDGRLLIRAEGERHTLLLREARAADAGSYTATATNELGQASCAAALAVRPGREPVGPGAPGGMSSDPTLDQCAQSVLTGRLSVEAFSVAWPQSSGGQIPKGTHTPGWPIHEVTEICLYVSSKCHPPLAFP